MFNIRNMYVLFWFRKSEAKQKNEVSTDCDSIGSICCRITIDTKSAEIGSMHLQTARSGWDANKQQIKGHGDGARRANRKLSEVRSKLERIFELLQIEHAEDVSPPMVKDLYCGKKLFRYTIAQLVAEFFRDRTEDQKAGIISTATMVVHTNYARNFATALDTAGLRATAPTAFCADALDTVRTRLLGAGLGENHVSKHLKFVKQVWKHSLRKKRIKHNPLDGALVRGASDGAAPDTTHLSVPQLQKLIEYDFFALVAHGLILQETAQRLDRERDAFVFSAFTGMHHADYSNRAFRVETHSNDLFLVGTRAKTKVGFAVKLLAPAVSILKKYGNEIQQLPTKSNQKRNTSLKEISSFCRIPIVLSTKIARKTFANFSLNVLLMDAEDVAACLGLTSTKYLRHYARIKEIRIAKKMRSWDEIIIMSV